MTSLEGIVRPFQTNNVSPPQRYANAGTVGVINVRVTAGRSGAGKTMSGAYSFSYSCYADSNVEEQTEAPQR